MIHGVHIFSAIIGFVLMKGSIAVWLSHVWPWYRRKVEHIFLRDQNIYASGKSYSGTITFLRWWALVPGFFLILPRGVLIDVLIVVAIILIWYFLFRKTKQSLTQNI